MKAILTSIGLTCPKSVLCLKRLDKFKTKIAIIVPTASKNSSQKYILLAREQLESLGYKVTMWDWSNFQDENNLPRSPSLIYVAGGDTPYLMHYAERAQPTLLGYLKQGATYLGVSAGSVILGKSIKPVIDILDDTNTHHYLTDGLGLVAVDILPHYNEASHCLLADEYESLNGRKLLRLTNDDALVIDLATQQRPS